VPVHRFRSVLHRVPDEVPDNLLQSLRIGIDGKALLLERGAHTDALLFGLRRHGVEDRLHHPVDDDVRGRHADATGRNAGHVQQIFNEASLRFRVSLDSGGRALHTFPIGVRHAQRMGPSQHCGKRRTQLFTVLVLHSRFVAPSLGWLRKR
jgi:hypothetical protein